MPEFPGPQRFFPMSHFSGTVSSNMAANVWPNFSNVPFFPKYHDCPESPGTSEFLTCSVFPVLMFSRSPRYPAVPVFVPQTEETRLSGVLVDVL